MGLIIVKPKCCLHDRYDTSLPLHTLCGISLSKGTKGDWLLCMMLSSTPQLRMFLVILHVQACFSSPYYAPIHPLGQPIQLWHLSHGILEPDSLHSAIFFEWSTVLSAILQSDCLQLTTGFPLGPPLELFEDYRRRTYAEASVQDTEYSSEV